MWLGHMTHQKGQEQAAKFGNDARSPSKETARDLTQPTEAEYVLLLCSEAPAMRGLLTWQSG